ncbi:PEGA domain-containing protein [Candidatus Falkowbacteria bacterium]|nr:PEGA domain-containing protein [Candidatus Falkowbacteria bacterium]
MNKRLFVLLVIAASLLVAGCDNGNNGTSPPITDALYSIKITEGIMMIDPVSGEASPATGITVVAAGPNATTTAAVKNGGFKTERVLPEGTYEVSFLDSAGTVFDLDFGDGDIRKSFPVLVGEGVPPVTLGFSVVAKPITPPPPDSTQLAQLAITSFPSGATIFVDGEEQPFKTDVVITDIPAGAHEFRLVLDRHEEVKKLFLFKDGDALEWNATLVPVKSAFDGFINGRHWALGGGEGPYHSEILIDIVGEDITITIVDRFMDEQYYGKITDHQKGGMEFYMGFPGQEKTYTGTFDPRINFWSGIIVGREENNKWRILLL